MMENIDDVFVKCMRQLRKVHLYHLLGESVCYLIQIIKFTSIIYYTYRSVSQWMVLIR